MLVAAIAVVWLAAAFWNFAVLSTIVGIGDLIEPSRYAEFEAKQKTLIFLRHWHTWAGIGIATYLIGLTGLPRLLGEEKPEQKKGENE